MQRGVMQRVATSMLLSLVGAGSWLACSDRPVAAISAPSKDADTEETVTSGDATPDADAASDGEVDASMDGSNGVPVDTRLGIVPVPLAGDDGIVSSIEELSAHLHVIGAGARAASLVRHWNVLYAPQGIVAAERWEQLERAAALYRDEQVHVAFTLGVVDRRLDARQSPWTGNWSANATLQGGRELVDRTFLAFGTELRYLCFGHEIDRWLDAAPDSERTAFVTFVEAMLDYARQHADRPKATRVGVSVTYGGSISNHSPELVRLMRASDVVGVTYVPADEDFQASSPDVAKDLDRLVAEFSSEGDPTPIIVEVGYPSRQLIGSSSAQQRDFFAEFLSTVEHRGNELPFVNVHALNDELPERCAVEAASLGADGDQHAEALRCSLGLRHRDSAEKPAYTVVLEALARTAGP